jgi:2'-5' RNA ligase
MIGKKQDVLFLCIFVPPDPNGEIDDAIAMHGLRGRMVEPERRHLSLIGFGEPRDTIIEQIDRAIASAKPRLRPFGVVFEQLVISARQSLLLPGHGERIQGLERFDDTCLAAFGVQGLQLSKDRSSRPHVTLGYDGVDGGTKSIDPVSWQVRDVSLIVSHQGEHRYTFLERFALDGAGDGRSCQ